jgi:hypothetical protein
MDGSFICSSMGMSALLCNAIVRSTARRPVSLVMPPILSPKPRS